MIASRTLLSSVAMLFGLVVPERVSAQDMKPLDITGEANYYAFWPGTWYRLVDGKADMTATSFTITKSVNDAVLREEWRMVVDSTVVHAIALRAWDKISNRWGYTWVSDNGLYQVWDGRKVGNDWFIERPFEIAGQKFLSRQSWVPAGPDRVVRTGERSFDNGMTWQPRFREDYVRVNQSPAAADSSTAAITAVVQRYLDAQRTGNGDLIRAVFHPAARVDFLQADTLGSISREAFAQRFSGRTGSDGPSVFRLLSIDLSGNAAVAKVELNGARGRVVDFLTLMKLRDGWSVVAKATDFTPAAP